MDACFGLRDGRGSYSSNNRVRASKKIEDYAGARPKGLKWAQDLGQRLERCAAISAAKFVEKRLGNGLHLGIYGREGRTQGFRKGCGRPFAQSPGVVMILRFRALVIRDARLFMSLPSFPKARCGVQVEG